MPEGVEVRVMANDIRFIVGKKIVSTSVIGYAHCILEACNVSILTNNTVSDITVIGKFIHLKLCTDDYIEINLNMGGSFKSKRSSFSILEITLESGEKVYYDDIDGYSKWVHYPTESSFKARCTSLGFDILSLNDTTLKYLSDMLYEKYPKKNIKALIMDQYCIGGIGNIYATEGLFCCGINPTLKLEKITLNKFYALLKQTQHIMKKSLDLKGMSVYTFRLFDGTEARGQTLLKMYGKHTCPTCNGLTKTILVNNRKTTYCPTCQQD